MGTWIDVPNSSSGNARGIELPVRQTERQEFKPTGVTIQRKTKANSFIGYLQAWKNKFTQLKNPEMVVLMEEFMNKFYEFYPARLNKLVEIEILDGWKGKDKIEVFELFDADFRIRQHSKDKDTGEVSEVIKEIRKEDVNKMICLIKKLPLNEPINCHKVAEMLGYSSWKGLWKERQEYFQFYYEPIKVIEALGWIHYSGRGIITRIK